MDDAPSTAALMLALAHALDDWIEDGRLECASDAARRMGLTRARVSQLMRLLDLSPQLQEQVLLDERGRRARALRPVARHVSWADQDKVAGSRP